MKLSRSPSLIGLGNSFLFFSGYFLLFNEKLSTVFLGFQLKLCIAQMPVRLSVEMLSTIFFFAHLCERSQVLKLSKWQCLTYNYSSFFSFFNNKSNEIESNH